MLSFMDPINVFWVALLVPNNDTTINLWYRHYHVFTDIRKKNVKKGDNFFTPRLYFRPH